MSVYHTVHTSFGPFVIAFPCNFCQCPRAKIPYSCFLGYGRPVSSSLQFSHRVLLNPHYRSHLLRTSTWSYLTETNNSSVHDALGFYLLENLWQLYSELYAHINPGILVAQPVASSAQLAALPSTSVARVTSSSSTATSCSSNVSAASTSWNSNRTGSNHSSPEPPKRLAFAPWHCFSYFDSLSIHRVAPDSSQLFVYSLFVLSKLLFRSPLFSACWFLDYLLRGWNYYCFTFLFVDSSMLSMPCPCCWNPLSYRRFR